MSLFLLFIIIIYLDSNKSNLNFTSDICDKTTTRTLKNKEESENRLKNHISKISIRENKNDDKEIKLHNDNDFKDKNKNKDKDKDKNKEYSNVIFINNSDNKNDVNEDDEKNSENDNYGIFFNFIFQIFI